MAVVTADAVKPEPLPVKLCTTCLVDKNKATMHCSVRIQKRGRERGSSSSSNYGEVVEEIVRGSEGRRLAVGNEVVK